MPRRPAEQEPPVDLEAVLDEVATIARPHATEGEVRTEIPSLADADAAEPFGLAVVGLDGTEHVAGDVDTPFPIQSISKVFTLVLAMQKAEARGGVGAELWTRVGREPSGDPFNSLVQIEHEKGIPRNPMINAGALVVDDLLLEQCDDARASLTALVSQLAGADVPVDDKIVSMERTGHRNRAMAHLMKAFDNLRGEVDDVMELYVHQCALTMTARQLARAVRFLGNDGVDPGSGERILADSHARRVAAIMLTCGTYDAAGEFAFDVGFPCKSGIAGGIMGVVDGELGVCVWSPPLDERGNSIAGRVALHELTERLDLAVY
jgi:glutaminase